MEKITLEKVVSLYLEDKRKTVKMSTLSKYADIAYKFCDSFAGWDRKEITEQSVLSYIEGLGQNLSPSSLKCTIIIIKNLLRYAYDMSFVDSSFNCDFPRISIMREEPKALTYEDSMRINKALSESMKLPDIGILLALNTGLRIGEICALKWENIDFGRKSLSVKGTAMRIKSTSADSKNKTELVVFPPKTQSSVREVPVPGFMLSLLESLRQADGKAYILTGGIDKIPEPRNLQRSFKARCKNILGYCVNFHALRHTFASLSISDGTDPKTVSKILGHSSVITTLNLYRTVSFQDKCDAIYALEKAIGPGKIRCRRARNKGKLARMYKNGETMS